MKSFAIAHAMKRKAKKMAMGGKVDHEEHMDEMLEPDHMSKEEMKEDHSKDIAMMDEENESLADKIMAKRAKKYSKGGMVSNEDGPIADDKEAKYDDLVLDDHLEGGYTDKNSGDELGNEHMDEQDHDLVERIMKSRAKKDRLPRPL